MSQEKVGLWQAIPSCKQEKETHCSALYSCRLIEYGVELPLEKIGVKSDSVEAFCIHTVFSVIMLT